MDDESEQGGVLEGLGRDWWPRWQHSQGPFSLTPALSLGERELRSPVPEQPGRVGFTGCAASVLPLPKGEGRGEGEQDPSISHPANLDRSILCCASVILSAAQVVNGGFESGGFEGWTADPNWAVVDNSCGYYSGWAGKYWAWSGGKGEPATGVLTSKPFVLDNDGVRLLVSGWSSIHGTGQPRRWNYVTLNLADGTELDRVYAPDTTAFVPVLLDGSKHRGQTVFVRAVDDADQADLLHALH